MLTGIEQRDLRKRGFFLWRIQLPKINDLCRRFLQKNSIKKSTQELLHTNSFSYPAYTREKFKTVGFCSNAPAGPLSEILAKFVHKIGA